MKRILLLTMVLSTSIILPAQGIYNLWGMTSRGGNDNLGIIFKTDGTGNNFQVKHELRNPAAGALPQYTQLVEFNNKFYGMTQSGGTEDIIGVTNGGIIFEWDPVTNIFLKKIDFKGPNGLSPAGSLTFHDGKFYGMTQAGGSNDAGVIFEWDPATNICTTKMDMVDSNGTHPQGDLLYCNGSFYGVTYDGGSSNYGVIFQWEPLTNHYSKIIDFDGANGRYTNSHLLAIGNKVYGVTDGAIFKVDAVTNEYSRVFEFDYYTSGEVPGGNLAMSEGKLYGYNSYFEDAIEVKRGIFEWDPSTGEFTRKITFNDIEGQVGYLTVYGGKFYGLASDLIGSNNKGTIFEWDPVTNVATKKFDFDASNGAYPMAALTFKDGLLYGMTSTGGAYGWDWDMLGNGVIFQWDPSTNTYTKKIDFMGSGGMHVTNGLSLYSGKLYGRTNGIQGGFVFEYDPVNSAYIDKTFFGGGYNSNPSGNLISFQNKLYGLHSGGGARGYGGSIAEWDPATDIYTDKLGFGWPSREGYFPSGSLTLKDGKFYGSMQRGGTDEDGLSVDEGVLFEWDPVTNVYNKKIDMRSPTGSYPGSTLTLFRNKLYGTTTSGGGNGVGVIFEWDPVTNQYEKKIDLTEAGGIYPCELLAYKGKMYGMSARGGNAGAGVLFQLDPATNIYTKKIDFNASIGSQPVGNLVVNNNKIYGMTGSGGSADAGVIFEWDPVTNIYTKKKEFTGTDGAGPANGFTLVPAPVSNGVPGNCIVLPSIIISSSNNNQWVPVTDNEGNAVAEIKANGNNLGIVTTSMFINSGAVREDGTGRLYLDRSITMASQFPQHTAVDIRLYIKGTEFTALKNAHNSFGQTAGINNINDVGIFKINGRCAPVAATISNLISTTGAPWENDYVLSASINSFTSFYFASKNPCAAPIITGVSASPSYLSPADHQMKDVTINYVASGNCFPLTTWLTVTSNEAVGGTGNCDLAPDWIIIDEHHVQLRAERSSNRARVYTITVNAKNAFGTYCKKTTKVIVNCQPAALAKTANDTNENEVFDCKVMPNPASQHFNLQVTTSSSENISVTLLDASGRFIREMNTANSKLLQFGDDLLPGSYFVKILQNKRQKVIKIIKQ